MGGAILVPYPNRIRGKLSADGNGIVTQVNGKTISLPDITPDQNATVVVVEIEGEPRVTANGQSPSVAPKPMNTSAKKK